MVIWVGTEDDRGKKRPVWKSRRWTVLARAAESMFYAGLAASVAGIPIGLIWPDLIPWHMHVSWFGLLMAGLLLAMVCIKFGEKKEDK